MGTGFHPELTGRENIYLNGAILGMHRGEIERKFDEIVAFAEIEHFLDTPVKRYSSGMYVRLAFAVAAHLEPEILLVDEVLAVGDAQFQKKCLGKMGDVAKGRPDGTCLSATTCSPCRVCVSELSGWITGQVVKEGEAVQVVSDYLGLLSSTMMEQVWDDLETAPGNDTIRVHRMCVRPEGNYFASITMDTPLIVELELWNLLPEVRLH